MLFDYHFVLPSNTCQKKQSDFTNNERTKRSRWLLWGSFSDPGRPLQKRKWRGINSNLLSSLVTVPGGAAVPLISCYSELLFGNQNGLYTLFILLAMGRRMVMCSPQKCKGEKNSKKKRRRRRNYFWWFKQKTIVCYFNVTPRKRTNRSEARRETDLFSRKVIWQRKALIQPHTGWYLPELPWGEQGGTAHLK